LIADVIDFMAEIGKFAQEVNHHPRWENLYQDLSVHLTTWDISPAQ
jgi:pterin-4a-carbinolamine dehydratase